MAAPRRARRPAWSFYLAGADPHEGDRLGRLKLSAAGLAERDRRVFDGLPRARHPGRPSAWPAATAATSTTPWPCSSRTLREALRSLAAALADRACRSDDHHSSPDDRHDRPHHRPETTAAVDAAITSRRSIRAFLPTPVPRETIEDILARGLARALGHQHPAVAGDVLTGAAKDALSRKILRRVRRHAAAGSTGADVGEYAYYPTEWRSPYIDRRRKVGWDLYGLLGIGKTDKARMHAQHGRNYGFFDAPVGLIFTIDRMLRQGSWLDYGMFLQNIMVAARARGLDTCPQAAFMQFHRIIARAPRRCRATEMVVCGMSLGYADESTRSRTAWSPSASRWQAFARFIE